MLCMALDVDHCLSSDHCHYLRCCLYFGYFIYSDNCLYFGRWSLSLLGLLSLLCPCLYLGSCPFNSHCHCSSATPDASVLHMLKLLSPVNNVTPSSLSFKASPPTLIYFPAFVTLCTFTEATFILVLPTPVLHSVRQTDNVFYKCSECS